MQEFLTFNLNIILCNIYIWKLEEKEIYCFKI